MSIPPVRKEEETFKSGKIMFAPKPRVCIGFIEHPSDMLLEMDASGCLDQIPDVMWRVQKMNFTESGSSSENDDDGGLIVSSDVYKKNKEKIRHAASAFLPRDANSYGSVDIMALACTSMSFALGPSAVHQEIRMGYPSVREATDMATAVKKALTSIAIKKGKYRVNTGRPNECDINKPLRILMLTPYMDEVHEKNVNFIQQNADDDESITPNPRFEIVHSVNLGLPSDIYTSAVEPDWILEKLKEMALEYRSRQVGEGVVGGEEDVTDEFCWNVVFIGCSAMRATGYGFIERCEKELSVGYYGDEQPFVITSTQTTMWHALHKSGKIPYDEISNVKGYGHLFAIEHC